MTPCPICRATGDDPCITASGRPATRQHTARVAARWAAEDAAPPVPAVEPSPVWESLTDIQADAVRATAQRHLRDTDALAEELAPLLTRETGPVLESLAPVPLLPRTMEIPVVFDAAAWSLLGYTEDGSTLRFGPVAPDGSPVNDPLTPYPPGVPTP